MQEAARLALNLARNCRWRVFPCDENKHPTCPHGFQDATNDPDAIATLWRHPGPLIGVATGAASGFDVLDIDLKHDAARAWWHAHHGELPDTRTFRSRSGGLHLHLRHAPGLRCSAGRLAPGIDVRGDGGYVIFWFAAGLECLDHTPPAAWSDSLLSALLPKPNPPMPAPFGKFESGANLNGLTLPHGRGDRAIFGALRLIAEAQEGERNSKLHWAACRFGERIRAGAIGAREAEAMLTAAAAAAGLAAVEAARTIRSGLGRGA